MKTVQVVAAAIREGGRIFVTQRGYGPYRDKWEFPGGKIEPGETPEQALIREIREELNTTVEVGDFIGHVEYDYPEFHVSMDCYFCTVLSGRLELVEHEAAKWLLPEELDSVDWLPSDRNLVDKITGILTSGERNN